VDDNATNREILQEQCGRWGMASTTAHDGREALTALRAAKAQGTAYDLVIMDQHMPEMDGPTAIRAINAEPGLTAARVILLTSVDAECTNIPGIARVLTKPVRTGELQEALAEIMGAANQEAQVLNGGRPTTSGPRLSGHVLVAEDNQVNQELARGMLENLGCRVTVVATGLAAVAAIEQATFDAVFMDVQMPEMDGLVATATIREREARGKAGHVPIIALTANAFVQDREACLAAGMNDYIAKPFTMEKLRAKLARWLSSVTGAASPAQTAGGLSEARAASFAAGSDATGSPATDTSRNGHEVDREVPEPLAAPAPGAKLDVRALDQIRALERPGAPSMLGKVVQVYLTTTPQLLTAMRAGMAERDPEAVRQAAHSLKSASANLGAKGLAQLCQALEGQAKAGGCPEPGAEIEALEAEFQQVQRELEAELQRA